MKKRYLYILLTLFVITTSICCNSNQREIEKIVKNDITRTLLDPSSYESIKFTIDTIFADYLKTYFLLNLLRLDAVADSLEKVAFNALIYREISDGIYDLLIEQVENWKNMSDYSLDNKFTYDKLADLDVSEDNNKTFGIKVYHRYKTLSRGGSTIIVEVLYLLSPSLDIITSYDPTKTNYTSISSKDILKLLSNI